MLVALENTKWDEEVANHIYFLNDKRTRVFGYVPFGTSEPRWFAEPRLFEAKGRSFIILEKQPDPK